MPLTHTRRRTTCRNALAAALLALAAAAPAPAHVGTDSIVEAREALRRGDKARLAALRDDVTAARHPLAMWVDYWELGNRLRDARQDELDAFYARWNGSYVEDRLRNDWLLELGRRRDWANFVRDHPHFRMNDDLEVACYALLTRHLDGHDVKAAALAAWTEQRDLDDGCHLLASTLAEDGKLADADIWREVRASVDANRLRAARAAAALLGPREAREVDAVLDKPARFLKQRPGKAATRQQQLAVLALMRVAAADPDAAAAALDAGWDRLLGHEPAAAAWAGVGRRAAQRLGDNAFAHYQRAWKHQRAHGQPPHWGDETLAWAVRAAVRAAEVDAERWALALRAIDAMSDKERADPAWAYWKARAALDGARSDDERAQARALFEPLAGGLGFYAHLAAQALDRPVAVPAPPPPLTEAELEQAAQTPGLQRGLQMAQAGLRSEGRREWNFTLRGMTDRQLLAAAHLACQAGDWQLCINTSERTRDQVDLRQRYPTPFAAEITARAREQGLDPALVFGLIRQETRFMASLTSSAGAIGLMQVMPATARWTARKIGIELKPGQIGDVDTNLRLGTGYLKLVLDDFAGSLPLAAAAYNAGPNRSRRWREGPSVDAAAWAENVPFNETRDYVKKVLANTTLYAHLLGGPLAPLATWLGRTVGPRPAELPDPDARLP